MQLTKKQLQDLGMLDRLPKSTYFIASLYELNRRDALCMKEMKIQELKDFHAINYSRISSDDYFDKLIELFEKFENRRK